MLSKQDKKILKSTIIELKKIKRVFAVILFGSYARNEEKPISDIDICVLADKKIPEKTKAEITSHSSDKLDISIFWDLPPAIRYSVLKEGNILFSGNEESIHAASAETMSEYLDFKHIIDRHCNAIFGVKR